MTKDSPLLSKIKRSLSASAIELRAAGIVFLSDAPVHEDIIYHCEAAIENALRAFLIFRRKDSVPNMSIKQMADACIEAEPVLKKVIFKVILMKPYSKAAGFESNAAEAKEAILIAEKVFQAVLERIPIEVFNPAA